MATNEEMLVSMFQETSFHQIFFYFGKYMLSYCQPMPWFTFVSEQFQNYYLVAIFNLSNFVIFKYM